MCSIGLQYYGKNNITVWKNWNITNFIAIGTRIIRRCTSYVFIITILYSFCFCCSAEAIENNDIFDVESYLSSIPKTELSEDEVLSGTIDNGRIGKLLISVLSSSAKEMLSVLPEIISLLVLAVICKNYSVSNSNEISGVIIDLIVFFSLFKIVAKTYMEVVLSLEKLNTYSLTLCGVMISFMNFEMSYKSATVIGQVMVLLCSVLSFITVQIFPFLCAVVIVSAISGLNGRTHSFGTGKLVGLYMTTLGGSLSILSLIFSFQKKMASGQDSIIRSGAKVFSSYAIPVVGGAVSESLDNITLGFSLLKNSFGFGAALLIIFSVLPDLVGVLLVRIVFSLLASFCEISGANNLTSLISAIDNIFSVMLITLALNALAYLYTIFIFCETGL